MPGTWTRKIWIQLLQLQRTEEGAVRGANRYGEKESPYLLQGEEEEK